MFCLLSWFVHENLTWRLGWNSCCMQLSDYNFTLIVCEMFASSLNLAIRIAFTNISTEYSFELIERSYLV
jgi:hypothetical protein